MVSNDESQLGFWPTPECPQYLEHPFLVADHPWPEYLGSMRAVIRVNGDISRGKKVYIYLPWRRVDLKPYEKKIIVIDENGNELEKVVPKIITDEFGLIAFECTANSEFFYVYYLPFKTQDRDGYYKKGYIKYNPIKRSVLKGKMNKIKRSIIDPGVILSKFRKREDIIFADLLRFEARTSFDSFYPMETPMTRREYNEFISKYRNEVIEYDSKAYLVFVEKREFPIKMEHRLSIKWFYSPNFGNLSDSAARNEYYTFQIAVYAVKGDIEDVVVDFEDLYLNAGGGPDNAQSPGKIDKEHLTCFNLEGYDYEGKYFKKRVDVREGTIVSFWIGLDIKEDVVPGRYKGTIRIGPRNGPFKDISVELTIGDEIIHDRGDDTPWNHSKLRWINSRKGLSGSVIPPYHAPEVSYNEGSEIPLSIGTLLHRIDIDKSGLPTRIYRGDSQLLHSPIRFRFFAEIPLSILDSPEYDESEISSGLEFEYCDFTLLERNDLRIRWSVKWKTQWYTSGSAKKVDLIWNLEGMLEFDGYLRFKLFRENKDDGIDGNDGSAWEVITIHDVFLEAVPDERCGKYFMGMGFAGGKMPQSYFTKWSGPFNSLWFGDHSVGLYIKFLGASYTGPLLNLYKPKPPASWDNAGRGWFEIVKIKSEEVRQGNATNSDRSLYSLRMHTGEWNLYPIAGSRPDTRFGDIECSGDFEFSMLLTPVKPLNPKSQFIDRYYHNAADPYPTKDAIEAGIKIVNVHHANTINPYINYPFLTANKIRDFAADLHKKGIKTKIYYTVRELSNHAVELFALRSLGDEIIARKGRGGLARYVIKAYPWLMEHLRKEFGPEWYARLPDGNVDAAVLVSPISRWLNFYLEGLNYLLKKTDIDGLYLDDVSFGRPILQRMRRIMNAVKEGCIIDLHSNTGFSKGSAIQYMEFFPYIDKIWFGESFNYDKMAPDEWLVQVSGIPFGLMGDMLQGGGNKWLGMVFGMTTRLPWLNDKIKADPKPVWRVWDQFGIADSEFIGYWDDRSPICIFNKDGRYNKGIDENVKGTLYLKINGPSPEGGIALISIGNFSNKSQNITIRLDYGKLSEMNGDLGDLIGDRSIKWILYAPFVEDFQEEFSLFLHFNEDGAILRSDSFKVGAKRGFLFILRKE